MIHKSILILSDIEGSSCCTGYESGRFLGIGWPEACLGMTRDVDAVVKALFRAGAETITVKDFHRTAWNILPEYLDPRARLISGYKTGPVPGIGSHHNATAVIMLGMHAPSGATDGFLPHTLTSRISRLEVNGNLMTEAQLFSASLSPFGVVPVFFSGCPVACHYAKTSIDRLKTFPITDSVRHDATAAIHWRNQLADETVKAVTTPGRTKPYDPDGPFLARVTMRDGADVAVKLSKRWNFSCNGTVITITADDIHTLYGQLIRLCYLTPLTEKILPIGVPIYSLLGYLGQLWVKMQI